MSLMTLTASRSAPPPPDLLAEPLGGHLPLRPRDAHGAERLVVAVQNRGRDAAEAVKAFLVVEGDTPLTDRRQFLEQPPRSIIVSSLVCGIPWRSRIALRRSRR